VKKLFLVISVFLFCTMPVSAITLKGSVEYTVDTARAIAFENVNKTIPIDEYKQFFNDFLHYSNIDYMQKCEYRLYAGFSHRLVPFYNKKGKLLAYGICYDKTPDKVFYYNRWGDLIKIEFNPTPNTYPRKNIAYNTKGELYTVALYVAPGELYIFDKNGKFVVHWVGNYAYNEKGEELKITRRL